MLRPPAAAAAGAAAGAGAARGGRAVAGVAVAAELFLGRHENALDSRAVGVVAGVAVALPQRAVMVGLGLHVLVDLADETGLFRHGQKIVGLDQTTDRMLPADERFHTGDAPILE